MALVRVAAFYHCVSVTWRGDASCTCGWASTGPRDEVRYDAVEHDQFHDGRIDVTVIGIARV